MYYNNYRQEYDQAEFYFQLSQLYKYRPISHVLSQLRIIPTVHPNNNQSAD